MGARARIRPALDDMENALDARQTQLAQLNKVTTADNLLDTMKAGDVQTINLSDIMGKAFGQQQKKRRKMRVAEAWDKLVEEEQDKRLDFGFSDRVRVYLNGRLLFQGDDTYRSRDYRFLGSIGYFDALYLPLRKGENELLMAVSEDLGGWAALENLRIFKRDKVLEHLQPKIRFLDKRLKMFYNLAHEGLKDVHL